MQVLSILNRTGQGLATLRGSHGQSWPELTREHTVTAAGGAESYPLPDGFVEIVGGTMWDDVNNRMSPGPSTPQEWTYFRQSMTGPSAEKWRIAWDQDARMKRIQIYPAPADGAEFVFSYISDRWVRQAGSGAVSSDRVSEDGDVPVFPPLLMELGIEWRLRKAQGLSFTSELAEFETQRDKLFGAAAKGPTLHVGMEDAPLFVENIPEGSWG